MYFIGVDLGWKDKKTTGICVLDENLKIRSSRVVLGSKLLATLKPFLSKTSTVAVDAPLTLGKGKGKLRLFEKFLLTKPFRRWKANPLPPALIYKLSSHGQEVVGKLEKNGFKLNQTLIEVFPTLLSMVMKKPARNASHSEAGGPACVKFIRRPTDRHKLAAFYAAYLAYLHFKGETFWIGWRDGKLFLPIYYYWKKAYREAFTKIWRHKNRLRYRLLLSNLKI
jgi:predicted nuclease with RNAse H fold